MSRISNWLLKISRGWLVIATLLVMAVFMAFVLPAQSKAADRISGDAGSPDLAFSYQPEEIYRMAEAYRPQGRQAYIQARWTFDVIFPAVYVAFLAAGISWSSQQLPNWPEFWKRGNLVPVLGGIFDLLENTGASVAMALYPARHPFWPLLASMATPIKWILVSASFGILFITAGGALLAWIKNQLG